MCFVAFHSYSFRTCPLSINNTASSTIATATAAITTPSPPPPLPQPPYHLAHATTIITATTIAASIVTTLTSATTIATAMHFVFSKSKM